MFTILCSYNCQNCTYTKFHSCLEKNAFEVLHNTILLFQTIIGKRINIEFVFFFKLFVLFFNTKQVSYDIINKICISFYGAFLYPIQLNHIWCFMRNILVGISFQSVADLAIPFSENKQASWNYIKSIYSVHSIVRWSHQPKLRNNYIC